MHMPILRLSLAPLLVLAFPLQARATSVEKMSPREMAEGSSTIIHGTVLSTSSHWNEDRSLIVTDVQVQVIESLKGDNEGIVVVTQPGGQVGKIRVDVPGALAFRPGEEVILFLAQGSIRNYSIAGLSLGRFEVFKNKRTGEKLVRGGEPRGSLGSPTAPLTDAPVSGEALTSLSSFLGEVRRLVVETREGH